MKRIGVVICKIITIFLNSTGNNLMDNPIMEDLTSQASNVRSNNHNISTELLNSFEKTARNQINQIQKVTGATQNKI